MAGLGEKAAGEDSRRRSSWRKQPAARPEKLLKITPVLPELNSFQLKLQASSKEPVSVSNWLS